jgi:hypothetical protein
MGKKKILNNDEFKKINNGKDLFDAIYNPENISGSTEFKCCVGGLREEYKNTINNMLISDKMEIISGLLYPSERKEITKYFLTKQNDEKDIDESEIKRFEYFFSDEYCNSTIKHVEETSKKKTKLLYEQIGGANFENKIIFYGVANYIHYDNLYCEDKIKNICDEKFYTIVKFLKKKTKKGNFNIDDIIYNIKNDYDYEVQMINDLCYDNLIDRVEIESKIKSALLENENIGFSQKLLKNIHKKVQNGGYNNIKSGGRYYLSYEEVKTVSSVGSEYVEYVEQIQPYLNRIEKIDIRIDTTINHIKIVLVIKEIIYFLLEDSEDFIDIIEKNINISFQNCVEKMNISSNIEIDFLIKVFLEDIQTFQKDIINKYIHKELNKNKIKTIEYFLNKVVDYNKLYYNESILKEKFDNIIQNIKDKKNPVVYFKKEFNKDYQEIFNKINLIHITELHPLSTKQDVNKDSNIDEYKDDLKKLFTMLSKFRFLAYFIEKYYIYTLYNAKNYSEIIIEKLRSTSKVEVEVKSTNGFFNIFSQKKKSETQTLNIVWNNNMQQLDELVKSTDYKECKIKIIDLFIKHYTILLFNPFNKKNDIFPDYINKYTDEPIIPIKEQISNFNFNNEILDIIIKKENILYKIINFNIKISLSDFYIEINDFVEYYNKVIICNFNAENINKDTMPSDILAGYEKLLNQEMKLVFEDTINIIKENIDEIKTIENFDINKLIILSLLSIYFTINDINLLNEFKIDEIINYYYIAFIKKPSYFFTEDKRISIIYLKYLLYKNPNENYDEQKIIILKKLKDFSKTDTPENIQKIKKLIQNFNSFEYYHYFNSEFLNREDLDKIKKNNQSILKKYYNKCFNMLFDKIELNFKKLHENIINKYNDNIKDDNIIFNNIINRKKLNKKIDDIKNKIEIETKKFIDEDIKTEDIEKNVTAKIKKYNGLIKSNQLFIKDSSRQIINKQDEINKLPLKLRQSKSQKEKEIEDKKKEIEDIKKQIAKKQIEIIDLEGRITTYTQNIKQMNSKLTTFTEIETELQNLKNINIELNNNKLQLNFEKQKLVESSKVEPNEEINEKIIIIDKELEKINEELIKPYNIESELYKFDICINKINTINDKMINKIIDKIYENIELKILKINENSHDNEINDYYDCSNNISCIDESNKNDINNLKLTKKEINYIFILFCLNSDILLYNKSIGKYNELTNLYPNFKYYYLLNLDSTQLDNKKQNKIYTIYDYINIHRITFDSFIETHFMESDFKIKDIQF